ncbi:MAG: glycosyltransferase [Candidatus Saccharibacteria bacterium]
MYWLVGLLVAETVLEGLICGGAAVTPTMRRVLCGALGLLLVGFTAALIVLDWQVWIWTIPFVLYRLINLLRVSAARMPAPQLRTVAVRAFGWLVAAQVLTVVVSGLATHFHIVTTIFDIGVALQLLCAVVLLRASTHTWRHAGLPADWKTLSDKELPSLSVLVPARNETEELERCLQALTASDYPKLEILVLDDCSANRRTPEIIRSYAHAGVRFIQGGVPDESRWLAKNYAYAQLAHEASGELLLFCGVDAGLEPQSMRELVTLLQARNKDMLSVMPLRSQASGSSLLQAMRYYWEICLPRRFFKRPPVLSTCWLIKRAALERMGGFEAISRSVNPEAPLARQAVVTDAYSFVRSDESLGIYSNKPAGEQYGTSVRVRYPQLHRRLELVALVSLFELLFLLGPLIGLCFAARLTHTMAYVAVWCVALFCLLSTYALVAVGARLTTVWFGWLLMPVAFCIDLALLHISLWKYEFSTVDWKGRNVCIPVMQVAPRPPKQ